MVDANLVLQDLTGNLKHAFPEQIADVVLFGSHLRGDAREDSDYDFVIIWNGKMNWEIKLKIHEVALQTDLKFDVFVHTLFLGTDELQTIRGEQPVFAGALTNGRRAL